MDNILEIFIKEPEKEFHVRQISKILNKSPTTISKYLKNFEKQGILKSKKKFNHLLFKANTENRSFRQNKLFFNLKLLQDSGLIDFLENELNHPEAIILFGSFAKAENLSSSDIDLLIISPLKKEIDLKKFEKKIGYKIQIFIRSKEEINKMKEKNKELLNNWVNGILISGYWEVF